VADGWCWFVVREKYCWLVAGGWFVLTEKYCWLVADKPNEQPCLLEPEKVGFGSVTSGDGPIVDPNAGRLQFRRCFV
jgi:hypothetical protein